MGETTFILYAYKEEKTKAWEEPNSICKKPTCCLIQQECCKKYLLRNKILHELLFYNFIFSNNEMILSINRSYLQTFFQILTTHDFVGSGMNNKSVGIFFTLGCKYTSIDGKTKRQVICTKMQSLRILSYLTFFIFMFKIEKRVQKIGGNQKLIYPYFYCSSEIFTNNTFLDFPI